jgi:hypothetical protein
VRSFHWLALGMLLVMLLRIGLYLWAGESTAFTTDFDLLYYGAVSLTHGENPYLAIHEYLSYPLFYPLPAVLLGIPFTLLPIALARPVWDIAVGCAFGYALWRVRGPYALLALLSGAYLFAMRNGQATPLLVAASLFPAWGFLLTVKPNTGLALWCARPSRAAVIGSILVLLVSVIILPSWPLDWWAAIHQRSTHIMPPLLRPFGFLLLLAALRWRTPEGRLVLALAVIPQHTLPHELVPLALIPANIVEMAIYATGSWLTLIVTAAGEDRATSLSGLVSDAWPTLLVCVYLPMLWLVLRRRQPTPLEAEKEDVSESYSAETKGAG